jgi:hypothetical protein
VTTDIRTLLGLCALTLLAACATPPEPEPESAPKLPPEPAIVEAPEPPPPPPPEPDKSAMRISIASVGDMMIGTDYPRNHLPDDDGVSFLADVAPILSAADITFGNLEGVLIDGGEPGKKCSNPNACYLFRSPTRYAEHYRNAGFDVLSLANNHARDFGEEGRTSSMNAIAAAGMRHSGRVDDFASFEHGGLRIAVLAYAVTKNSNMLLDYELAFTTVADFAKTHDIVVVSFHGGAEGADVTHVPFADEEYYGEPRGDVVWFARGVVDAGADLVIGHGPHVVRGHQGRRTYPDDNARWRRQVRRRRDCVDRSAAPGRPEHRSETAGPEPDKRIIDRGLRGARPHVPAGRSDFAGRPLIGTGSCFVAT